MNISKIFRQSRFYYLKKHFGVISAIVVSLFLSLNKRFVILLFFCSLATFLYFYRINEFMPFIGDQAWFYLSARDLIVNGEIPLVGIASSRIWLHQGPLWTYLLVPVLFASGFNPVSAIYLTAFFGISSILLIYKLGVDFFSFRLGIFLAIIYITSPLVLFHSRFAYHTSPIPFFFLLLYYSVAKWISGNALFFPIVLFSMSVLYNLHLATVVFWPVIVFLLFSGFIKKKPYVLKLKQEKVIIFSFVLFFLPMVPILLFDIKNGFPQTIVFLGWSVYKFFQSVGSLDRGMGQVLTLDAYNFFIEKYQMLTISVNQYLSLSILTTSTIVVFLRVVRDKAVSPIGVLFMLTIIGVASFFVSNVSSEAYLVMLFPGLIFFFTYLIYVIKFRFISNILLGFVVLANVLTIFSTSFLTKNSLSLEDKIAAAKKVVELAQENEYSLVFKGESQHYVTSVLPYEYLTWWLGKTNSSKETVSTKIVVTESGEKILVERIDLLNQK